MAVATVAAAIEELRADGIDGNAIAALLSASSTAFLISLTSGVSAAISWTTVFKERLMPRHRDPGPDHKRVYDASAARDADAARKVAELLEKKL